MMNNSNEQFSFTLPKSEKLKSKIEIDLLFQSGTVVKTYPFRLLFNLKTDSISEELPQILISVPKRRHKLAVTRNLMRRRIFEAYRLNKLSFAKDLKKIQSIGIIYASNRTESFNFINDKLISTLERLSETLNKNKNE